MERCPNCDCEVSHTAKYCPDCGHKLFWTKMRNISLRGFIVSFLIVAVGIGSLFLLEYLSADNQSDQTTSQVSSEPAKAFHQSFDRFHQVFEPMTDVQRKVAWDKYKNECVEWTGRVKAATEAEDGEEYIVTVEHPSDGDDSYSYGPNVWVYYPAEKKSYILSLNKGDRITYKGTLIQHPKDRYGNNSEDVTKVLVGC